MGRMTRFERAALFAFCLNAVDVVITVFVTSVLGMIEFNPIMAGLLNQSPLLFASIKLAVVGGICMVLRHRYKKKPEEASFGLGVVVGMLIAICLWQVGLLLWATTGP